MLFIAELICSDDDCAEAVEAVGHLRELESLVCEGCGCTLQVLSIAGYAEARAGRAAVPVELPRAA
jgi:hypothetical protein